MNLFSRVHSNNCPLKACGYVTLSYFVRARVKLIRGWSFLMRLKLFCAVVDSNLLFCNSRRINLLFSLFVFYDDVFLLAVCFSQHLECLIMKELCKMFHGIINGSLLICCVK